MTTPCIGCDTDATHGINFHDRLLAAPMTTSALRQAWAPACPASDLATINLHGEGRITIRRGTEPAWHALNTVLIRHNYRTRKADTGAYNCRQITGGTGFSLHAYGIAADLNWQTNPYGDELVTDMPAAMIADIKALRTISGARLFRWGGDYSGNKDAMHFEIVCTPADVASGIIDPNITTDPGELDMDEATLRNIIREELAAASTEKGPHETELSKRSRSLVRHLIVGDGGKDKTTVPNRLAAGIAKVQATLDENG